MKELSASLNVAKHRSIGPESDRLNGTRGLEQKLAVGPPYRSTKTLPPGFVLRDNTRLIQQMGILYQIIQSGFEIRRIAGRAHLQCMLSEKLSAGRNHVDDV